jgi:hypothetical protein
MKREIDLVRHILFSIEHRGAICPLESLRADLRHESDERIRYHLQLAVDAGWVAEVGRSVAGAHGVRLTNAGHDFIEVARDDARWRAAKVVVIEETGGQSLAMMRALLTKWAWRTVVRSERQLRPRRRSYRYVENAAPAWWARAEYPDADFPFDDTTTRLVRRRRANRQHVRPRPIWNDDLYGDVAEEFEERRPSATLPPHII